MLYLKKILKHNQKQKKKLIAININILKLKPNNKYFYTKTQK